ncbi:MAG: universal stress protein [Zoogloeaceae bacterium]|nr:universal stress protein [Zoogloeaceae bacterium]
MYKRILVAIDDSFMTDKVLDTAIALSKSCGATLGLLHALDETMFGHHPSAENLLPNSVGKAEFRMRKGAGAFLDKAAQRVAAAGVEAELKLVESETKHISDMLVDTAKEWNADLLIVGTHGRPGMVERFFVGSVAERIVRRATTSVLLVRGELPSD